MYGIIWMDGWMDGCVYAPYYYRKMIFLVQQEKETLQTLSLSLVREGAVIRLLIYCWSAAAARAGIMIKAASENHNSPFLVCGDREVHRNDSNTTGIPHMDRPQNNNNNNSIFPTHLTLR